MESQRSSTAPELLEEFCLGLLHAARGVGIAQCGSDALEDVDAESRAQVFSGLVKRQQRLQRSLIALVANPFAASCVDLDLGLGAGAVVVQVGVEELPIEAVDAVGVAGIDVSIADVLADDGAVFGLDQSVVAVCRGRLLVCSMSSLLSSWATVRLMNSLPLSV